ncbi:SMC-Scp complex subunit ScpB [Gilvimarinus algae]|uniref:SMC-Scp complex subunit ScpB n=1 Tax=Gilvimarinus algae TaxID=3058037 RepID=A0ABT8TKR8_9GAMM|nr:SMC-Scp complex subunit ScpB [Gilvimarinus sp. SDUM040014]MDO3384175.1 SMC-Scp complex subunit ScpB [Gilvimarinus sp. SDUM040014]
MDIKQLQAIVEGALLAAGEPLSLKRLETLFDEGEAPEKEQFMAALEAIGEQCAGRGFELKEVASGWRLQVREEMAPWVNRLWEEKPQKYSRALLETLALIAYRQPITRGDIEEIRGVAVSSHIIKTLAEREWIKVVGQRDVPGRPSLYATTRQFLDYFNLKSLDQLPTLSEIRDIDEINAALDLDGGQGGAEDEGEDRLGEPAQPGEMDDTAYEHDDDAEVAEVSSESDEYESDEAPADAGDEVPSAEDPADTEQRSA